MKKTMLCSLFTFLLCSMLYAQEDVIVVKGIVRDVETNDPLAYCNIFIKGKTVGTVTNEEGEFEFNIPVSLKKDTMVISYLGYTSFEQTVESINTEEFTLAPAPILLSEISVGISSVLEEAQERIRENFPIQPFIYKGFYRDWKYIESFENDTSSISLLEAAVTVYDKGYKNVSNKDLKESVYLDEIRRNQTEGNIYNYLNVLLLNNFVRHSNSSNLAVIGPFQKKVDFKVVLEKTILQGKDSVHVITGLLPNFLGKYEYHIRANDLAILAIYFKGEMSEGEVLGQEPMPWIQRRNEMTFLESTLQFREYEDKMYPQYIKMNWKSRTVSELDTTVFETKEYYIELLVNEIIVEDVKALKSTLKNPMSDQISLERQIKPYNEAFWKSYNIVKKNPLDEKLLKLLERGSNIDDQFQNQKSDPERKKKKKKDYKSQN